MKKSKNIIICLCVLSILIGCNTGSNSNTNNSNISESFNKDYQPRELYFSGVIHQGSVFIPFPLEEHKSEIGIPYAIAELRDGRTSFINTNPSNLCNKGNTSQCSSFNRGWIESLIVTENYIISVEDSLSATSFEGYLTIRNLDGSNRKEIFKLKTGYLPLSTFEIQSDNENIYFVHEDQIYSYSIKSDSLETLTDNEILSGIRNLKLDNKSLYFSANQYQDNDVKYSNSIFAFEEEISLKVANITNEIIRVYSDKYFTRKDTEEGGSDAFINYYKDTDIEIPLDNRGAISVLSVNENVVTYETVLLDEDIKHFIRLYKDTGDGLKELDSVEFPPDGPYFLHAIENNRILLGLGVNEFFGAYIEPITIDIVDGKLTNVSRYPYVKR